VFLIGDFVRSHRQNHPNGRPFDLEREPAPSLWLAIVHTPDYVCNWGVFFSATAAERADDISIAKRSIAQLNRAYRIFIVFIENKEIMI
jgi:hypothetical protein